ncbi:MAG: sugar phosphate nucleotidyltransferase [Leptospirales bacterium]|nr:sugar phosphate nucleotidyltransferase [Leptospirales bacterium]
MKIVPVIMAGGAGTRLWPLSRDEKPKQFHNLSGQGTLLEETIKRLLPLSPDGCVIVTSYKYVDMSIADSVKAGLRAAVLAEPQPKNTSAAILYAAAYLNALYEDSVMVALPADHHIRDGAAFANVLSIGAREAENGKLVTIGIRPDYPETGYGYIKALTSGKDVSEVERFVEKPDAATAAKYIADGTYYWNAGIFIWKTSVILDAFKKYLPEMFALFEELILMPAENICSMSYDITQKKISIFEKTESISIDYGILEKASNRVVIPADFGWVDLGSWKSIDGILKPDELGNRTPEPDKTFFVNSRNCSAFSEGLRISVVGLENVIVVQAGDDILIVDKDASQDVKKLADTVKNVK